MELITYQYAQVTELHNLGGINVVKISAEGGEAFSSTYANASETSLTAYLRAASATFEFTTIDPNSRAVMLPTLSGNYSFYCIRSRCIFIICNISKDTFDWKTVSVGMYIPADGGKLARIKRIIKTVVGGSNIYNLNVTDRFLVDQHMHLKDMKKVQLLILCSH